MEGMMTQCSGQVSVRKLNLTLQHSMKVVFLCNRLSRTKLRGSWQALLEAAAPGAGTSEEVNQGTGEPSNCANTVKGGDMEVRPGGGVGGGQNVYSGER